MANTRSHTPDLSWQPSLLDAATAPGFDPSFSTARRIALDADAWVDRVPGFVSGAALLFAEIVERAPWEQRRVHMYERMVDEPRLTAWYGKALIDPALPPIVGEIAHALTARYNRTFDSAGAALYRDGRDSVAWHGDRIPLDIIDPIVAILSLGSNRTLRMREKAAHANTRAFTLEPGDLFVMGGTSQRTWEHSVPKVARAGPRMSLQFRHSSNDTATSAASTASDAT
jgi:alkylated DNA repair dioxygenase AlkB